MNMSRTTMTVISIVVVVALVLGPLLAIAGWIRF